MKCERCGKEVSKEEIKNPTHSPYSKVCKDCYKEIKATLDNHPHSNSSEIADRSLFFPNEEKAGTPTGAQEYEMKTTPKSKVNAKISDVPLDLIRLDPDNRRFRHVPGKLKDPQLEEMIWKSPATKSLYDQIKWSGGLQEKPIIQEKNDHYIVKEGNKRIVCLRRLKQEADIGNFNLKIQEIDPVQCIVLPKEISKRDESVILSRVHVKGKSQWGAFQKASHIYDMVEEDGLDYDDIKEGIGISKAKAKRMKNTFKNLLRYREKFNDENWGSKYSYFYELEKKRYTDDKKNPLPEGWVEKKLDKFMEWVQSNQIEEGRDIRKLPKIVRNGEAYEHLSNGGTVKESLEILSQYDPTAKSKSFSRLARLEETISNLHESEEKIAEIAKNSSKLNFLKSLQQNIEEVIEKAEGLME